MCYAVKDAIIDSWMSTKKEIEKTDPKTVYYMSMEFLMGRALGNNLINLTYYDEVKEALEELGCDLNAIEDEERMPRWVTAVWAALPPASWTLWQRLVIRLTAAASVTITVCSSRKLKTATRWRCRMSG